MHACCIHRWKWLIYMLLCHATVGLQAFACVGMPCTACGTVPQCYAKCGFNGPLAVPCVVWVAGPACSLGGMACFKPMKTCHVSGTTRALGVRPHSNHHGCPHAACPVTHKGCNPVLKVESCKQHALQFSPCHKSMRVPLHT